MILDTCTMLVMPVMKIVFGAVVLAGIGWFFWAGVIPDLNATHAKKMALWCKIFGDNYETLSASDKFKYHQECR